LKIDVNDLLLRILDNPDSKLFNDVSQEEIGELKNITKFIQNKLKETDRMMAIGKKLFNPKREPDMMKLNTSIADAEDNFLAEVLSVNSLKGMTKEEIYKLPFKCPYCQKIKTSNHLVVLLSQIQVTTENIKDHVFGKVTRKMGVCCDECNELLYPVVEEGGFD